LIYVMLVITIASGVQYLVKAGRSWMASAA